ncbi:hypothetical protein BGZ58_003400 [Dissophora ornata]|nr:hypothetical protein BGZ58_003400 [Dissophora ornata]
MDEHEPQEHQDDLMDASTLSETKVDPTTESTADEEVKHSTTTEAGINPVSLTDSTDSPHNEALLAAEATHEQDESDADGFGDFGSAPKAIASDKIEGDDDGFGDFGDFGTSGDMNAGEGDGNDDDDDGFGDFGEVQEAGTGDGDDDFGDFNDFADGDGFQDSGDFGDFEGGAEDGGDGFGASESVAIETPAALVVEEPIETAPDFTPVNSREVENYVLEQLAVLYPIDDHAATASIQLLNSDLDDADMSTVLSEQELWKSLVENSFHGRNNNTNTNNNNSLENSTSSAPQFQWKYSNVRKEYYASLGMVVAKEQNNIAPSSIPYSLASPTGSRSKVSSPMMTEAVPERKPLDIGATLAFCQFTKENLGGYSGDEMKDIIAQLTEMTRQASDELTHWLDQREQMIMDSERFNEMIASLVGRAAKLKDAESKQNTKTKRLTRTSFHLK